MSKLKNIFETLPNQKLLKKYVIVFFMSLCTLLLCAQLIAQLFTIEQLKKIKGKVIDKQITVTSYQANGRRRGIPNYSLVVDLDNKKSYNIDLRDNDWNIDTIIKKGDIITIYNPSALYRILSLDILDFGNRVSQVELGSNVVYSFDAHKKNARPFIGFLMAAICLFCYFLYDCYKNG